MYVIVEGCQGDFPITKLQLAQRGIDDLPVQFEGFDRLYANDQLKQGGDGSARGEYRDTVLRAGLLKQTVQSALDAFDKTLPASEAFLFVLTRNPSLDYLTEQALEFGSMVGCVLENLQCVGLDAQQIVQVRPNNLVSEEFIERRIDLDFRLASHSFEGSLCSILLTLQFATDAAVEAQVQLREVVAQSSCLAKAER